MASLDTRLHELEARVAALEQAVKACETVGDEWEDAQPLLQVARDHAEGHADKYGCLEGDPDSEEYINNLNMRLRRTP